MFDGLFVEDAFLGLDARPLDGESVSIVTEGLGEIKVLFVSMVMITGDAGDIVSRTCCFALKVFPMRIVFESSFGFMGESFGVLEFPF